MRLIGIAILLACGSGPALAAEIPASVRTACMSDYHAHCSTVRPGGGRMIACFAEAAGSLSPGCFNALSEVSCRSEATPLMREVFPCPD